ncbi:MAG: hypothetical protein ACP5MD_06190, partial [Verrucomicrobiia bacterium]
VEVLRQIPEWSPPGINDQEPENLREYERFSNIGIRNGLRSKALQKLQECAASAKSTAQEKKLLDRAAAWTYRSVDFYARRG